MDEDEQVEQLEFAATLDAVALAADADIGAMIKRARGRQDQWWATGRSEWDMQPAEHAAMYGGNVTVSHTAPSTSFSAAALTSSGSPN